MVKRFNIFNIVKFISLLIFNIVEFILLNSASLMDVERNTKAVLPELNITNKKANRAHTREMFPKFRRSRQTYCMITSLPFVGVFNTSEKIVQNLEPFKKIRRFFLRIIRNILFSSRHSQILTFTVAYPHHSVSHSGSYRSCSSMIVPLAKPESWMLHKSKLN